VLVVSYPSPHPPFTVPQRLLDLYPPEDVTLPPMFAPGDRPQHPALVYLRRIFEIGEMSEEVVRRMAAAYFALITHTDEQIAQVVEAAETLGLGETTRFLYTSDHGEMHGSHGIYSKCCMYEGSVGVPLMLCGPGVPAGGRAVRQSVSHVDLFPTIVESVGAQLMPEDEDLPGVSLWPAINGTESTRHGFAEHHADGAASGVFMLREQDMKLVHYVGMAPQLFDLAADPDETLDLAGDPAHGATLERLTHSLLEICDPDEVDRRAKADQHLLLELWGGREKVAGEIQFGFTPVPA
jgi:choline-sulfatase